MTSNLNRSSTVSTVDIEFPLSGLNVRSIAPKVIAEISQKSNTHDVAEVTLPNLTLDNGARFLGYGAPAILSWSSVDGRTNMVGYVHHSEPYTSKTGRGTKITMLSAGMPLKERRQRVFSNSTASQVAKQIASDHGLRADIEPHPRLFHQITQSGESDWELLCSLAKRIGYSVRVEGVTLQFVSRETLARYYRPLSPELTTSRVDDLQTPGLRGVLSFAPLVSEHQQTQDESLASHTMSVVNTDGRVVTISDTGLAAPGRSQGDPAFTSFHSVEAARTLTEARQIVEGAAESNRYPVRAHVILWGNPLLAPNRVVYLSGLNDGLSGYWTILETRHMAQNGPGYQMEAIIGTESLGNEQFSLAANGKTVLPPAGLLSMPYPSARLNQGIYGAGVVKGTTRFTGGPRWAPAN